jgi:hypothetical protein
MVDTPLFVGLMTLGELSWLAVYILIVRRSFKDRTYGVPMFAICANCSWEFIFSFVEPYVVPHVYVYHAWFAMSLVLVYQYLCHGREDFPAGLPGSWFLPRFAVTFLFCALGILCVTYEFNDFFGLYSAFGQCLIMSVLFIHMALRRPALEGQSLYTAMARWLATAICATVCCMFKPESKVLNFLYISIFCVDAVYVYVVYHKSRALGLNPWRRL